MRVKIFSDNCNTSLETAINDFISKHEIIDIKFSSSEHYFDVMILYK